ncbi:hypothetical protein IFM89_004923 [Coptis chinensis]|uniref:SKP1-like protein n=1 Tax=Coptis chinensis TaxID=261450 RepID=A0A835HTM8_9MAGN|nr:hypothetical protein IFM89_004923 [Coptis chinensis]
MTTKMITLKSSDGEAFEVEENTLLESQMIKNMIDEECNIADGIPLPNVNSHILARVIEYLKKHAEKGVVKEGDNDKVPAKESKANADQEELKNWDAEFVKELDQETRFDLILAANYLNIKSLLDLTCQTVADMIKNMKPEEIREIFSIENDFTPEEEAQVRKENEWAFD